MLIQLRWILQLHLSVMKIGVWSVETQGEFWGEGKLEDLWNLVK